MAETWQLATLGNIQQIACWMVKNQVCRKYVLPNNQFSLLSYFIDPLWPKDLRILLFTLNLAFTITQGRPEEKLFLPWKINLQFWIRTSDQENVCWLLSSCLLLFFLWIYKSVWVGDIEGGSVLVFYCLFWRRTLFLAWWVRTIWNSGTFFGMFFFWRRNDFLDLGWRKRGRRVELKRNFLRRSRRCHWWGLSQVLKTSSSPCLLPCT